jgi:hypothetical protein
MPNHALNRAREKTPHRLALTALPVKEIMMMRFFNCIMVVFLLITPHTVAAADAPKTEAQKKPLPIEDVNKIEALDNSVEMTEDLGRFAEKISRKKYSDCIKTFGHPDFCRCLREESPVGIDFGGYVHVLNTSKEELGYVQADKETKDLIDNTLKARDTCVGRLKSAR